MASEFMRLTLLILLSLCIGLAARADDPLKLPLLPAEEEELDPFADAAPLDLWQSDEVLAAEPQGFIVPELPESPEPLDPADEGYIAPPGQTGAPTATGETIDLRPPDLDEDDEDLIKPTWVNDYIDDFSLLTIEQHGLKVMPQGDSGFGLTSLGFGFPLDTNQGPFWADVFFDWTFLAGPLVPEAPPQVYNVGVNLKYAQRFDNGWTVDLKFSPQFASDFGNSTRDSLRLVTSGLASYEFHENLRGIVGLAYLDRPDIPFLPIAGLRWQPNDDVEVDLLIPRPRISWRFNNEEDSDDYLYVGGSVDGGSWAIEQRAGREDIMSYYDIRAVVGVETRAVSGARFFTEIGYAFRRHLEFQRSGPNPDLDGMLTIYMGGTQ